MAMTAAQASAIPGVSLSWPRLGGLLGIIGVVLFIVGAIVEGDVPVYTDDPAEIQAWWVDNGDTFLVADFVIALGVIFGLVPFFATVRHVMAEAEGPSSLWPQIGFIGGILFVITGASASAFYGTLALGAESLSEDSVVALATASFVGFSAPGLVISLYFLALGIGSMRTGAFAAPIAWLCLLLAATGILSGLSVADGDPEGVFGILGWVTLIGLGVTTLAVGGSLLMRKDA